MENNSRPVQIRIESDIGNDIITSIVARSRKLDVV